MTSYCRERTALKNRTRSRRRAIVCIAMGDSQHTLDTLHEEVARRSCYIGSSGASKPQRVFSRSDTESRIEFRGAECRWIVYALSHRSVPPITQSGPCVMFCGGFAGQEEARAHALRVHNKHGATVLIGMAHEWMVCCSSIENIESPSHCDSKRQAVLAAMKEASKVQRTREDIHRYKMVNHEPTVDEWLEIAHLDECFVEPLRAWANTNGFTVHRIGTISDAESQELGINGPLVRRAYTEWKESIDKEAIERVAEDGLPAESIDALPTPEFGSNLDDESDGGTDSGTGTVSPWGGPSDHTPSERDMCVSGPLDSSLHRPGQGFALISVLPDTLPEKEHLFKLYNVTETQSEADSFVRNVAGDYVSDIDMFVVQLYQWVRLDDRGTARTVHRNAELNKMFSAQRSQAGRIRALQQAIENDELDEGLNASLLLKKHGEDAAQGMEEID